MLSTSRHTPHEWASVVIYGTLPVAARMIEVRGIAVVLPPGASESGFEDIIVGIQPARIISFRSIPANWGLPARSVRATRLTAGIGQREQLHRAALPAG